jgi:hypothetical protein
MLAIRTFTKRKRTDLLGCMPQKAITWPQVSKKLSQRNETKSQKVFHYPDDEVSLHLEVLDNNSSS